MPASPRHFPLFNTPIDLAHHYWRSLLRAGDTAIDATCGNGHDTLVLAELVLSEKAGSVFAIDLQPEAIASCKHHLSTRLPEILFRRIRWKQGCHSSFPPELLPASVALIAYNLGYLPGGCKQLTTRTHTTLESIQAGLLLLKPGGVLSLTCYPGHAEGEVEESALADFTSHLDQTEWSVCHHRWLNRTRAPSLLLIQKNGPTR